MPPTAKFSKEKIVEAALDIVRTEGFDALTARALVYFILHKRDKTVPASFYDRAQTDSRFGRRTAFD